MNKRISAFLLSVVLCLAMACPAFAAVGADSQITITVVDRDIIVKATGIDSGVSKVLYTIYWRYGESGNWKTIAAGSVQVSGNQCERTITNGANAPGVDNPITETSNHYVYVELTVPGAAEPFARKIWPENSVSVENVTLNYTELELTVGDIETLTATVNPEGVTDKGIIWSVTQDSEVVTFDEATGTVTAKAVGTATITATSAADSTKYATCTVKVNDTGTTVVPVEKVTLNKETLTLNVGGIDTLVATVEPATATNKDIIWSVTQDSEVVTFDETTGKVTAKAVGTATITATSAADSTKYATCTVKVSDTGTTVVSVTDVTLNKTTLPLNVGGTETLIPTVAPSNATNKSVTWKSSNTNIADVDATGKVTAKGVGTATITVTTADGGKTADCTVIVSATGTSVAVTGITLDPTSLTLAIGNTRQVTATVTPANATNKNVTWQSSNDNIATVDEAGNVTAKAVGTATITATTVDGGKKASCEVTVTSTSTPVVPVTGVTLNRSTLPLTVGGTGTLSATVAPTNASNKGVTWKSSNENVASVDATGKVTAKAVGTATITVTTVDGGKTAVCTVTVSGSGTTTYPGGSSTVARPGESGGNVASNVSVSAPASVTGGSVTISDPNAKQGSTVTLTVSPRTGYELDHITVKDSAGKEVSLTSRGNGVYAFTMPAGKVSVDYSFNKTSNKPDIVNGKATFDDVPAGAWYEEAVQYAYQHGIMNGIGDNKFSPDTNLTRAMIVQVLYNLEGKPTAPQGDFEDVPADKWYADPINWAASKGIVNGYGDGNFGPEHDITREQLAAILYRYAEFKKYDVSQKGDLSKFSDAASVSEWFTEAMEWAVGAGLIQGTNEGLLMPKSTATRAQVATVMQRFCEDVID